MCADEIHRNKPLAKTDFRVLEDCAHKNREVLSALWAAERTILAGVAVVPATERTDNIVLIPTGIEDSLLAFGLAIEVVGEGEYGVESGEVNHKTCIFGVLILYTEDAG